MKISEIYISDKLVISEQGYGRIYRFSYGPHKVDPRPRVLVLGRWLHPTTGNMLIGGINLNYLSEEEINRLRQNLAAILAPDRRLSVRTGNRMNRPAHDPHEILKDRYYTGLKLLPDIFKNSYRTYRLDEINEVSKETLRKWPSEKARETEERRKKWKEMSPDARREAYKKRAEMAAARRTAEPPAEPQPPAETPPSEYD